MFFFVIFIFLYFLFIFFFVLFFFYFKFFTFFLFSFSFVLFFFYFFIFFFFFLCLFFVYFYAFCFIFIFLFFFFILFFFFFFLFVFFFCFFLFFFFFLSFVVLLFLFIHDELPALLGEGHTKFTDQKTHPCAHARVCRDRVVKKPLRPKPREAPCEEKATAPAVIACDVYSPCAWDQTRNSSLSRSVLISTATPDSKDVPAIGFAADADWCQWRRAATAILFDTAGRLQIDTPLID